MIARSVEITSESGLHARPASMLVKESGRFQSNLTLRKDDKEVDLKSILGVMSLAVAKGDTVTIIADGPDEQEAVTQLAEFCTQLS